MEINLLNVKNLTVSVVGNNNKIVDSLYFKIPENSIVGLVGGSGSGKSTTGFSIVKLLDPGLNLDSGEILFKGRNLLKLSDDQLQKVRGGEISMIFQEPLNAFNPVFTIGYQIDEMMQYHTSLNKEQRDERVLELLDIVELPDPSRVAKSYPHQLSGGMRQRAMIAQAIAADPKLIIADEPTSSLDVTLQARIIDLFKKIRTELKLSILLITHDLGMVSHICDEVIVMNKGRIVESGLTKDVIDNPRDAYTKELMQVFKI